MSNYKSILEKSTQCWCISSWLRKKNFIIKIVSTHQRNLLHSLQSRKNNRSPNQGHRDLFQPFSLLYIIPKAKRPYSIQTRAHTHEERKRRSGWIYLSSPGSTPIHTRAYSLHLVVILERPRARACKKREKRSSVGEVDAEGGSSLDRTSSRESPNARGAGRAATLFIRPPVLHHRRPLLCVIPIYTYPSLLVLLLSRAYFEGQQIVLSHDTNPFLGILSSGIHTRGSLSSRLSPPPPPPPSRGYMTTRQRRLSSSAGFFSFYTVSIYTPRSCVYVLPNDQTRAMGKTLPLFLWKLFVGVKRSGSYIYIRARAYSSHYAWSIRELYIRAYRHDERVRLWYADGFRYNLGKIFHLSVRGYILR